MMTQRRIRLAVLIAVCALVALSNGWRQDTSAQSSPTLALGKIDFIRDIQPIFLTACASCHFGKNVKGELRLDVKALAMKGGISGQVIIPGNSKDSRLVHRILGLNDEKRMPLGGEPLKPNQIETIRRWIDQGAQWPDNSALRTQDSGLNTHWAFVAPVRPPLPDVKNKNWIRTPIDRFILSRLEKEGLTPSPEAGKVTLLRRLSLDLTGLPPSLEEIDAFLNDKSANAYEKQVDRLLGSRHYGERWGRHWLDAARYADSDGYEKDKSRQVWFYRDWVIKSLNDNKPYDRFIIEQIAGDLLPPASNAKATQEQIVATGFLRNSMVNEEGGIDPEQFRMEAMFDRMDAIGKSILGLTINCTQCHNHKYDPIRQEEYYRMMAFINNSYEGSVSVYTPADQMKRAETFRRFGEIEAELQHRSPDWRERMDAWEEKVKNDQPQWMIVRPEIDEISTDGSRYLPQEDGSFLVQGYAPVKHRVKMKVKTDLQNITAIRLELLTDPTLPRGGPGRSYKGSCALTEFEVEAAPAGAPDKNTKIKFARATSDSELSERELEANFYDKTNKRRVIGPAGLAIDGKEETAWGIDAGPGLRNQSRKAVFAFDQPVKSDSGTILTFYLKQNHGGWNNNDTHVNSLGRLRLSITNVPGAVADPLPQNVRQILAIPRERRSPAQIQSVFGYWRTSIPEFSDANRQIDELMRQHPEGSSQLVMQEREDPRVTHALKRGDFLRPDKAVGPGVPAFLHQLPKDAELNRLSFAKWLADRNSPTTARAMVNRIWQTYFGTGIVATPEDFGKQSQAPSHPELLDWLAVEFMSGGVGEREREAARGRGGDAATNGNDGMGEQQRGGSAKISDNVAASPRRPLAASWSLKHIHRLIVTSAVYRQSSRVTPGLMAKDPYNSLLARGPRFRVEAEIVRDIALAASGLLNPKVGGQSVFPPAPEFLFTPPASFGFKVWHEAQGEDRYRRAIYTFRYRSVPYPMLQSFDAPNADISCVRRPRSNTPLQSLVTLNETLFVEASRALALKTIKEGGATDEQKMRYAFRRVLAREPAPQETAELLRLLGRQTRRFESGELNPWNLATNDPDKPFILPRGVTMAQLASWTVVSRVLLNLDETITKE